MCWGRINFLFRLRYSHPKQAALMTTTVPAMAQTVKLIKENAPYCKVMIGGAVITQETADLIGADKYAKDAMEGARYAEVISKSE